MITQKEIHKVAVDHLFWEQPVNIPEKLCLIHSEVSEAMEADRSMSEGNIEEELADAVIRIFDLAEYLGIDLEYNIKMKHEVNKLRPIKHGKRY